jgi:hypothetical protein
MKTYDNNGKLTSEINHIRTGDGKSITSNTMYNNDRVVAQNISVQDSKTGKVTSTNTLGGKLLP